MTPQEHESLCEHLEKVFSDSKYKLFPVNFQLLQDVVNVLLPAWADPNTEHDLLIELDPTTHIYTVTADYWRDGGAMCGVAVSPCWYEAVCEAIGLATGWERP